MEKFSVVLAKLLETIEKNFCIYYTAQRQLKIIPVDRLFLTAIIIYNYSLCNYCKKNFQSL